MFESADDLARAAINLLGLAKQCIEIGQYEDAGAIEISAAALAVHVVDWHVKSRETTSIDKRAFAALSPEWELLRQIVNGMKHPRGTNGRSVERQPAWEDPDFWEKSALPGELIVQDGEHWRSVHGLVLTFCKQYLSHDGSFGAIS